MSHFKNARMEEWDTSFSQLMSKNNNIMLELFACSQIGRIRVLFLLHSKTDTYSLNPVC